VEKRASTIHREYVKKARDADAKYNHHDPSGGPGPVGRRLEEFGQIKALVTGPRAECSADLHSLVSSVADTAAERSWRRVGARNPKEAKAIISDRFFRTIGLNAIRENAAQMRFALGISLSDGRAAASRRRNGRRMFESMQEEYQSRYGCGPYPSRGD